MRVLILDKPRHQELAKRLRAMGVHVIMPSAGDVAGAIFALLPNTGVDMLMGIGGTPEGIMAACAVKVLGGGIPAAAFAGRRELMQRVAPAGDVYQAGTLSGNPLATAAGLATLRELDAAAYERLGELTDRLASGLAELSAERPLQVVAAPGLLTLFFSADPVEDFVAASACDLEAHARFCRAMLARGVYPPPSQFEAWFISLAHDEAAIDRTLEAAAESLEEALQ